MDLENAKGPRAVIKTDRGNVTVQLFPKQTPKTIKNFAGLVKKGYYDNIIFHRVVPDFIVQGGDPTGTGMGGESVYGEAFKDEFSRDIFNSRDALPMANTGPDIDGNQFFVVTNQNVPAQMVSQLEGAGPPGEIIKAYEQGGTPWLNFHHTVFGHVVDSVGVADETGEVQRDVQDRPTPDVVVGIVEIIGE